MPTRRYYANAAPQQTLASSITSGALACTVAGSFAGWPVQFPYFAALDLGNASFEIVSVTNVVGTTATIARGQDGTAATAHPAGATLNQVFVRQDMDEANAHTVATAGVHGISGSVVGTSDVQTLTNKTSTNPTINGANVSGTWAGTMAASGLTVTSPIVNSPAISNPVSTGDATHPALIGRATSAGGKTLSLQNSSLVEKAFVDDVGRINGVPVPTTFTNEAAASAALSSLVAGTVVYLSTPTGTGTTAGLFEYNGTSWVQIPTATLGTFTPTWTNLTVGNATQVGEYELVGKLLTVRIAITFGSTSAITGAISVALPGAFTAISDAFPQDILCRVGFAGNATKVIGYAEIAAGGTALQPFMPTSTANGAQQQVGAFAATFGTGSVITVQGTLIVA